MPYSDSNFRPRVAESVLQRFCEPLVAKLAVFTAFAVLLVLAWTRNVNWDEFYFLSHVYAHLDGRLDRPLQTVFVHAFGWLAFVPGREVEQIATARIAMTALLAVTCFSIFSMTVKLLDERAAWIATLAFLSSGYTLAHGASFRSDPIAAAGLMASLSIMFSGRMSVLQILSVAVLSACALLVTVKAVLYLPAYVAILAWRSREPGVALKIIGAGLLGLGIAAVMFYFHAAAIDVSSELTAMVNAQDALTTSLLDSGLFPRVGTALSWALLSFGPLVLVFLGIAKSDSHLRLLLIGLATPLVLSIIYYRNAFPYFFPFITPPLMVAAAVGAARVSSRALLGTLVALMCVVGSLQVIRAASEKNTLQRATLAEVHRLFPEPVPYIDHNAMVSSFPHQGFFMSTWGISRYRKMGVPIMESLISQKMPPLLIANRWALHQAMTSRSIEDHSLSLLPEDQATLRENYVYYSGAIWLAGRTLTLGSEIVVVDLPVRGAYRLVTHHPVTISGMLLQPGGTVGVTGPITIGGDAGTEVTLMWDSGVPLRPDTLPQSSLYAGF